MGRLAAASFRPDYWAGSVVELIERTAGKEPG